MSLDFGAPKAGPLQDAGKFMKLAQRVEKTLNDEVLFKEPKQLDPRSVLMSPYNRDGAPPSVQHIHHGILKGIVHKGFDRTRPQVGICVKYTSEAGKRALLEHNLRFSKGEPLLPPVDPDKALYGSLASSHLNMALRLVQAGSASPVGGLSNLTAEDPSLRDVVLNGHKWWVLPEDLSPDRQVDISLWRNQDQNENQQTHEMELLQSIVATAGNLSLTTKKVNIQDLVARASKRNPAKVAVGAMMNLAKYYTQFLSSGDQYLVTELVDYHSTFVNPRDLTVPTAFFQCLVSEEHLQKCPFTRHYLLLVQYST